MLSKKARYALHALMYLNKHKERGPLRIAEIAEKNRIPRKFLEAILVELRKGGLLQSKLGQKGGYALLKPPAKIMIGDIIQLIDGPIGLTPCAQSNRSGLCEECRLRGSCHLRPVFRSVNSTTAAILNHLSIESIAPEKPASKSRTGRNLRINR